MNDLFFIKEACVQAKKALSHNEVPIGAVLVDQAGNIIARAYNQMEKKQSQLAHAEMQVLAKAAKKLKTWRLQNTTLYVSVQPCLMCLGAIYLSRVFRVVYGAESVKFGISIDCFKNQTSIYKNLKIEMNYISYKPSALLLQTFFKKKRRSRNHEQSGITESD